MRFIDFEEVAAYLRGKSVAVVGSAPSVLENKPGFIDLFDIVVRVNNFKTGSSAGFRTDVHYAFYGTSIRKSAEELRRSGCKMCLCKLPNSQPLMSDWHVKNRKLAGIDYRYIYELRKAWWPVDTFIPDDERFLRKFELLGRHQPTTGFAAILDVLDCEPHSIYLTGYDGFTSGMHNVNELWREKNLDDPIRHRPDLELQWLADNADRFIFDATLTKLTEARRQVAA